MWDYIQKGWDYVTETASSAYTAVESAYEGSFLDKALSSDWFDSSTSKGKLASSVAGYASTALFGKDKMPEFGIPKGARLTGGARSAVSSGSYKANAVDLGYTAKVQNAIRAANNARAGSVIGQTVQRLQTRPAKGPLLQLGATPIKVSPRSRG